MSRTSRNLVLLLTAALSTSVSQAGCTSSKPAGAATLVRAASVSRPVVSPADLSSAAGSESAFGLDLYRAMAAQNPNENLMISPDSLTSLLAMLLPGTRGQTADEIAKTLHTKLPADRFADALGSLAASAVQQAGADGNALQKSDTLWTQQGYGIQPAYLNLLSAAFDTGVHETDFAKDPEGSRQAVNDLVQQETDGLIKDLFPSGSIDDTTRLALTDAVYFHAKWENPFEASATSAQPFHLSDGTAPTVQSMSRTGQYSYASGPDWQAVELPYEGDHLALDVLLPGTGSLDGFRKNLSQTQLSTMLAGLQPATVELALPKFTFDSGAQLNDLLRSLGMKTAFDADAADLSGIPTNSDRLYVSAVVEKAHVAVDENGTTAAAAGGAAISGTSALLLSATPVRMDVDRPFLFLIRDPASGQVLFLGQVTDPRG